MRRYEFVKGLVEVAILAESAAVQRQKTLKRDIINSMVRPPFNVAVTRAEKEYVDAEQWREGEALVLKTQDAKRAAEIEESIARQRVLTLRASILPVSWMGIFNALLAVQKIDPALANSFGGVIAHSDATLDGDAAYSDDPSVAHHG